MNKVGKLIAVWGSEGCGKTATAVRLAAALAEQNKDVILVHTDIVAPDIPVLLPTQKEQETMGRLWNNPNCSTEQILKACVTTKLNHLCLLGYKLNENVFSYSEYTKEDVYRVYTELMTMADYIMVDCVSYFMYNMLSAVALETADKVIRMGEANLKSFSFFDSNLVLMSDRRFDMENHIRVLSKLKTYQAIELAKSKLDTQVELPYTEELEMAMLEGKMFDKLSERKYKSGINNLVKMLESE